MSAAELLNAQQYFQQVLDYLEKEARRTDRALGYMLTPNDAAKLRTLLDYAVREGPPRPIVSTKLQLKAQIHTAIEKLHRELLRIVDEVLV